jgi:peroxiredoxin
MLALSPSAKLSLSLGNRAKLSLSLANRAKLSLANGAKLRVAMTALLGAMLVPGVAQAALHAGDPAPAFNLPRVGGGTLSSASLKGKPVYLNFFAWWCAPCNEEAPSVVQLYKKYHPRGLVAVGIDEQEDPSHAADFVKKYGVPFAAIVDADGTMGSAYGAIGLPVHVFIDRSGKISTYRLGEMEPAEIEAAIQKIL